MRVLDRFASLRMTAFADRLDRSHVLSRLLFHHRSRAAQRPAAADSSDLPGRPARSRFSPTIPRPARSAARCSRACSRSATACSTPRRASARSRHRPSSTSATVRKRSRCFDRDVAEQVVKSIWERDPDPRARLAETGRQFAVIDAKGNVFAYTGPKATDWAGNKACSANAHCTAQGNILARPGGRRQHGRIRSSERGTSRVPSRRGARGWSDRPAATSADKQSAALVIVKKDAGVWLHNDTVLRLQVDDNPEPIKELRRLVEKAAAGTPDSARPVATRRQPSRASLAASSALRSRRSRAARC